MNQAISHQRLAQSLFCLSSFFIQLSLTRGQLSLKGRWFSLTWGWLSLTRAKVSKAQAGGNSENYWYWPEKIRDWPAVIPAAAKTSFPPERRRSAYSPARCGWPGTVPLPLSVSAHNPARRQ